MIQEDDPRWDCHTMGNMVCGPGHELAYTGISSGALICLALVLISIGYLIVATSERDK